MCTNDCVNCAAFHECKDLVSLDEFYNEMQQQMIADDDEERFRDQQPEGKDEDYGIVEAKWFREEIGIELPF